jgi:hypothetical protein
MNVKKIITRWAGRGIAIVLGAMLLGISIPAPTSQAGTENGTPAYTTYSGDNVEDQNYSTWSSTIKSYLTYNSDGSFMRVQAGAVSDGYLVEYYDSNYHLTDTKIVASELSIFGGFYEMGDYYYILTGQKNSEESDDVEVYRITKYNKNWTRIDSCGLYGANTYSPFEAGSARMTSYGNYLMIRTCHEMYASSSGLHHQANVTIQVDTSSMSVVDSYYNVMNVSYGYVSHSFNQFIQVEDGKIVAVDHGDANPRSIVLVKYPSAVTSSGFTKSGCSSTDLIAFAGTTGANYTGASIGGFEISDSAYLVAGSQDLSSDTTYTSGRNIFVVSQSKSTGTVSVNYITDYTAGEGTTDTPQFVKIGTNSYMLLWHRGNSVYYTKIDGEGNQVGNIYSMEGDLSDCVPVVAGNKLVWYTWDDDTVNFYEISISDISKNKVTNIVNGHKLVYESYNSSDYTAAFKCSVCGAKVKKYVIKSYTMLWSCNGGFNTYAPSSRYSVGDSVSLWAYNVTINEATDSISQNDEIETISSDSSVVNVKSPITYNWNGYVGTIEMKKAGIVNLSIYPKYNTSYKRDYVLRVGSDGDLDISKGKITVAKTSYDYTGNAITPSVKVTYDGVILEENTDYTVSYSKNTNVGTAKINITGKGLFANSSATATFTINSNGKVVKTTIKSVTNTSSGVKLKWEKVAGASGYIIYRKASTDSKWTKVKTITKAATVSYTDKAVKSQNGTSYTYMIKTYKKSGDNEVYNTSEKKTITRLTTPGKLKVSNPSSKKIKVTWTKNKKASGYQIQYSTSKTFAKGNKTVKVSKSLTKNTISKLKKGKTYYVRIRAYYKDSSGTSYSAWSTGKKVKIKK